MPYFSIVMPLYNKAPYVGRALESVLGQTFRGWELWVVDDGSTDGSAEVVRQYSDPRIHLHRQANAGVSAARNRGVALSNVAAMPGRLALSGEASFRSHEPSPYLCFLDADDWWEATFLEELVGLIARHPDAGLYATSYHIVKNGRKRQAPIGVGPNFEEGEIDYFKVYSNTGTMPVWTGACCIPARAFTDVGGFNPQLAMAEDFDLWARLALQYKVVFLNSPLSNYNQDVDVDNRAIGSLKPPEKHFAFHADHLTAATADLPVARYTIEWVRIVCLKQYYLSRRYHQQALEALKTINLDQHLGKPHAAYLQQPLWKSRLIGRLVQIKKRLL